MYDLTIIKQRGSGATCASAYIDSREVAEFIGKRHDHLLRDIGGYLKILRNSNAPKIGGVNFFVESSYLDGKGETRPCYLLSKMGCEMVANKLTGEKGVLFTAAYVMKFNELEATEKTAIAILRTARLGEFNAASRIIVRAMKSVGVPPSQIIDFLRRVYEPIGISIDVGEFADNMLMYTATEIAEICGIYSVNGNPHAHAVSCILGDHIMIDDYCKSVVPAMYNDYMGTSVQYDSSAVRKVTDWLTQMDYPNEIFSDRRTFHIYYIWDLA